MLKKQKALLVTMLSIASCISCNFITKTKDDIAKWYAYMTYTCIHTNPYIQRSRSKAQQESKRLKPQQEAQKQSLLRTLRKLGIDI